MLGNVIEDQSEPVAFQGLAQALEIRRRPKLGIQRVVVDDVVPMSAAGTRPEKWGGVHMADTKGGQILGNTRNIGETAVARELQPIGRTRRNHAGRSEGTGDTNALSFVGSSTGTTFFSSAGSSDFSRAKA